MANKTTKNPLHKVSAEVIKKAAKKVGVKKRVVKNSPTGYSEGYTVGYDQAMEDTNEHMSNNLKEAKEAGRKQGMIQGLCLAIYYMYKGEDEKGIWKAAGLTIDECIANEVAEFDMDEIVKHWKELQGIPDGNY